MLFDEFIQVRRRRYFERQECASEACCEDVYLLRQLRSQIALKLAQFF